MTIKPLTAPNAEPVSLAEAKLDSRIDGTALDATLQALITAAREQCEHELGRVLIEQTWQCVLEDWPAVGITLMPGVLSVTEVRYTDAAGTEQTLAASAYELDADDTPAVLYPTAAWPTATPGPGAVKVTFKAGFGATAAAVPASIRQWIRAHVQSWATYGGALSDKPLTPNPHLSSLLDRWRTYA